MANVKSDGILPFDPALRDDLHFDLPFDASSPCAEQWGPFFKEQ
jgi:hypothetical protein